MKPVKVHESNSIRFTPEARYWCNLYNNFRKKYPTCSFKEMAELFNMSETNVRRYYYGVHHYNPGSNGYTQMRQGACVTL